MENIKTQIQISIIALWQNQKLVLLLFIAGVLSFVICGYHVYGNHNYSNPDGGFKAFVIFGIIWVIFVLAAMNSHGKKNFEALSEEDKDEIYAELNRGKKRK